MQPAPDDLSRPLLRNLNNGALENEARLRSESVLCPALDLRRLVRRLPQDGQHQGGAENAADEEAVQAANRADAGFADRQKRLIDWLQSYRVRMGYSAARRLQIAERILAFADQRESRSLDLDPARILREFERLKDGIAAVKHRSVTSLASKALWCCYPTTFRSSIAMRTTPFRF